MKVPSRDAIYCSKPILKGAFSKPKILNDKKKSHPDILRILTATIKI
jgi:hypothetical protein